MNKERENGMAWIAAAVLLGIIALAMLCGCGSKRKVTEYVAVHDTVWVNKKDTVCIEKVVRENVHDTTVIVCTDTIFRDRKEKLTLNEAGDTINHQLWDILTQKVKELEKSKKDENTLDSARYFQVSIDSILRALDRQRDKETVKTVPAVDWWQYLAFSILILGLCVAVLKTRK